jgi:glycine/D-amino acid oxidase-like deaminating enzyme
MKIRPDDFPHSIARESRKTGRQTSEIQKCTQPWFAPRYDGRNSHTMDLVSPQPFWPLKNGLLSVYPSLKSNVTCEVVLGGGISGAFVAEALSRVGFNVVVLDKRDVGGGSTSASTALLQYEIDTSLVELTNKFGRSDAEGVYRLCHDSILAIERLVSELNVDCVFQRRKSVYLASRTADAPILREECAARKAAGIQIEYWDEAEVSARFSFSRPAALASQQAAELDCHRLTHALLARALKNGARIYDRTLVEKYDARPNGVRLETDRGCNICASHAVLPPAMRPRNFCRSNPADAALLFCSRFRRQWHHIQHHCRRNRPRYSLEAPQSARAFVPL